MFFPLLAGLAIAFSLQLLLTNLGVALGLSAVGLLVSNAGSAEQEETVESSRIASDRTKDSHAKAGQSGNNPSNSDHSDSSSESFDTPVTHVLGLGITVSVAPVLFAASFLATEFSQLESLWRGAIFGTILWSVYVLIVTWLSSKTVSGIADVVLGGATAGIRTLFSAAKQISPLGSTAKGSTGKTTDALSEAERISLIVQELGTVMSTQDYLPMLVAQRKAALVKEIGDRTQLSSQQAETIIRKLSEALPTAGQASTQAPRASHKTVSQATVNSNSVPHWRKLIRMGLNQLDITDWDLESAWNAIQTAKGVQEALPFNIISLDIEDYLSEIPKWVLTSQSLETDLIERLYDPEADPELIKHQLQSLKSEDFMQWLMQRGDLSDETVQTLTEKLSRTYHSVLDAVEAKSQAILAASSEAARATVSENGSVVKVLKQLGTTAEKTVSEVVEKIDHQIASHKATDHQVSAHGPAASNVNIELAPATHDPLKNRLSEVQNKLTSYFRYTTLDKLTDQSVNEKLQSQLTESDLLTASGMISLGSEPVPQAVKSWLKGWVKTSSEELEIIISKRKGITKKQYALLKDSLRSAWKTYYSPLFHSDGFDESPSVEKQSEYKNTQRHRLPRRWASRAAQSAEKSEQSLTQKVSAGDWKQQILSQLESVSEQGSDAVGSIMDGASEQMETVETAITDTLESAQGHFSEAIASAQQKVEAQVEAAKHELQTQAEAVRHQAAIAAWWIFISLLTSELAAASAGWLAVYYPVG